MSAHSAAGLYNCSSESFALIASFLGGHEISKLYLCGTRVLVNRLRSAVVSFDLNLSLNRRQSAWPTLLLQFQGLRSIYIGVEPALRHGGPYLPSVDLRLLPKSLEVLKLVFANAFLSLHPGLDLLDHDSPLDPEPIDLPTLFPILKVIHVSNAYRRHKVHFKSGRLFRALSQLPLRELTLYPFFVDASYLKALPKTLERLCLKAYFCDFSKTVTPDWPPGLVSLSFRPITTPTLLKNLPNTLTELKACYSKDYSTIELPELPRNLRRLTIKESTYSITPENMKSLPPILEYFKLDGALRATSGLSELPSSLTHFEGPKHPGLSDGFQKLPPNLKTFTTPFYLSEQEALLLPSTIETCLIREPSAVLKFQSPSCRLEYRYILKPTIADIEGLSPGGASIRTLKLAALAHHTEPPFLLDLGFAAINVGAPYLRNLVLSLPFEALSLNQLNMPLETLEIVACNDIRHLFLHRIPNPSSSETLEAPPKKESSRWWHRKDKQDKKDKKDKKDKSAAPTPSSSTATSSTLPSSSNGDEEPLLWCSQLKSLRIWSLCADLSAEQAEALAKRLPRTLEVLRFFDERESNLFSFPGDGLLANLPPKLKEFSACLEPIPNPRALRQLPASLRSFHLGGKLLRSNINMEHIEAFPKTITSISLPISAVLPSLNEMRSWILHALELSRFYLHVTDRDKVPMPFEFLDGSPAQTFAAAVFFDQRCRDEEALRLSSASIGRSGYESSKPKGKRKKKEMD